MVDLVGRNCRLKFLTRGIDGNPHSSNEKLEIIKQTLSLGMELYLVKCEDSSKFYVLREEIDIV